ncbi:TetR/AcrR family transcriptional regulator [Allostreptomyces psammosilenae]|uniref:TetR/AcrR family transcriptional regulator n=1 Tax=Allostreptomyces psammosilenae TaxID=1892865 RepID=UPI0015CE7BBE|nr:TetR/AcrR family transcriptional regulator [Allostreptomyces psammosilenae]
MRERKRERTRRALSDAAITLFLRHGFDQVSVADIAAAAEVSKPTLFRYFPAKEDLVLHRITDHEGEYARVVRERPEGEAPLAALRRHFTARLRAHDPVTGLNDDPEVLAYRRLLYATPSLLARLTHYTSRDQDALAEALREAAPAVPHDLLPDLAAAQLIAQHQVLARANWHRIEAGRTAAEVQPEAEADAERAFSLLGDGLRPYYG